MNNAPMNLHFQNCNQRPTSVDSVSDTLTLLAFDAIYIKRKPSIITKRISDPTHYSMRSSTQQRHSHMKFLYLIATIFTPYI